jgi:hypothetical protein
MELIRSGGAGGNVLAASTALESAGFLGRTGGGGGATVGFTTAVRTEVELVAVVTEAAAVVVGKEGVDAPNVDRESGCESVVAVVASDRSVTAVEERALTSADDLRRVRLVKVLVEVANVRFILAIKLDREDDTDLASGDALDRSSSSVEGCNPPTPRASRRSILSATVAGLSSK